MDDREGRFSIFNPVPSFIARQGFKRRDGSPFLTLKIVKLILYLRNGEKFGERKLQQAFSRCIVHSLRKGRKQAASGERV